MEVWTMRPAMDVDLARASGAQVLERPELEDFKAVLRKYPKASAMGCDQWHARLLAQLDDDYLDNIMDCMLLCEEASLPEGMQTALIVLLGKPLPSGGTRPIGTLSMVHRAWMKRRVGVLSRWGRTTRRPSP